MSKAGFTGPRTGMTPAQLDTLQFLLRAGRVTELHHGDCLGSDAQAHSAARVFPEIRIITHPPVNPACRAFCIADEEREPAEYIARDRDIVDETQYLIATPRSTTEEQRSGTWATIRYARSIGRPILRIWPDGFTDPENVS